MHLKNFLEWITLKEKLDEKMPKTPLLHEQEIWWASLGENVGAEINGKNRLFSRPVIILRKLTQSFYFVIPVTTKPKTGTWYVPFKQRGKTMAACLHQARAIDHRRLSTKLGEIDEADFFRVKDGFHRLYR